MHTCECGHQPADHYGDTGACEHVAKTLFGDLAPDCHCPRYSRDDYQEDV